MISEQRLYLLELSRDVILQTIEPGIVILDSIQLVVQENAAASSMWGLTESMVGQRFDDCALAALCQPLRESVRDSLLGNTTAIQLQHQKSPECVLQITIKPLYSSQDDFRAGTLIYMTDVTPRERLQNLNEALGITQRALEAANEELQSANEQLQLTNEELETTNEELQTTNEELQVLNEELETTNDELADRATEIEEINLRYREMLDEISLPVFLVSKDLRVQLLSAGAQQLFGLSPRNATEMPLTRIPFSPALRQTIARRLEAALKSNRSSIIRKQLLGYNGSSALYDIRLKPLSLGNLPQGVMLLFEKSPGHLDAETTSARIAARPKIRKK